MSNSHVGITESNERPGGGLGVDSFAQAEHLLRISFDAEPVEDGFTHPAEHIIDEIVSHSAEGAHEWLFEFATSESVDAPFRASLLRVMSRRTHFSKSWRASIVEANLASENIEIRDAAVQAAESWGDPTAVELLRKHRETTPWLADYIARVIRDLTS